MGDFEADVADLERTLRDVHSLLRETKRTLTSTTERKEAAALRGAARAKALADEIALKNRDIDSLATDISDLSVR